MKFDFHEGQRVRCTDKYLELKYAQKNFLNQRGTVLKAGMHHVLVKFDNSGRAIDMYKKRFVPDTPDDPFIESDF